MKLKHLRAYPLTPPIDRPDRRRNKSYGVRLFPLALPNYFFKKIEHEIKHDFIRNLGILQSSNEI